MAIDRNVPGLAGRSSVLSALTDRLASSHTPCVPRPASEPSGSIDALEWTRTRVQRANPSHSDGHLGIRDGQAPCEEIASPFDPCPSGADRALGNLGRSGPGSARQPTARASTRNCRRKQRLVARPAPGAPSAGMPSLPNTSTTSSAKLARLARTVATMSGRRRCAA